VEQAAPSVIESIDSQVEDEIAAWRAQQMSALPSAGGSGSGE